MLPENLICPPDLILVIEDGEIMERGGHDELMAREERYHKLYTLQARI